MTKDLSHYHQLLLDAQARTRNELEHLGHVHPDDDFDYDPSSEGEVSLEPDNADRAALIEEFSSRAILEMELEKHYQEIKAALLAIQTGAYGKCIFCGAIISTERLEANPAARTCMLHAHADSNSSSLL